VRKKRPRKDRLPPLKLAAWLRKLGCGQLELSRRTGLTRGTIHNFHKGKKVPSLDTVARVCGALGITVEQLFKGPEGREKTNGVG
jgi:transcriptional regulator with XRE-family HTH domain